MSVTKMSGRWLGAVAAAAAITWGSLGAGATAQAAQITQPTPVVEAAAQEDVRTEILRLTNVERQKAGLKPLALDNCLASGAQKWSETMAAERNLYHGDLRALMRSCKLTRAAENVAMGGQTAAMTVSMWMNSPGHRRNILDPNLTKLGVGWAADGSWATQQFGA